MEQLKPVFTELAGDELLSKCLHGGTQNANEAFHHLIRQRCPQVVFVGKKRLENAVNSACVIYNDGELERGKLFELLGLKQGTYS